MCTFGDPAFIAWMNPFGASRIQSWLTPFIPPWWELHGRILHWEPFQLRAWFLGLCALNHKSADSCAMPEIHVVRTSWISQTWLHSALRAYAATSHFKLNQAIPGLPAPSQYPCPPVAGLQEDCVGGRNWFEANLPTHFRLVFTNHFKVIKKN